MLKFWIVKLMSTVMAVVMLVVYLDLKTIMKVLLSSKTALCADAFVVPAWEELQVRCKVQMLFLGVNPMRH